MAKNLVAIVKPKKKIGEMTDDERDAFAAQIVGAAASKIKDAPASDAPASS